LFAGETPYDGAMRWIEMACVLSVAQPLWAGEAKNPLTIDLVSENRSIAAGTTFYVGLHLQHPAGYHTYWKHPGIVGMPTTVEWSLPPGFKAGEIEWPAPESVKMAVYDAQGYHGETLLMVPITAPKELASGPVKLEAKVSWMCCGKECNPASHVPFSIELPVTAGAEMDPPMQALFTAYRAKVPQAESAWTAAVKRVEKKLVIDFANAGRPVKELAALGEVRFFTEDGQVDSDEDQVVTLQPGGALQLELTISEYAPENPVSLPGLIYASKGWGAPGPPFYIRVNPGY
jgi:thiol:disulfide interchange protein DsbD